MRFVRGLMTLTMLSWLAGLAACTPVRYVAPADGPVSRVRFATTTEDVTVVRQYDDLKCSNEREMLRLRNGFLLRDDKRDLGIPLNIYRGEAAKEVHIRAGAPFHSMFYGSRNNGSTIYSCGVMVDYTFEPNRAYELVYRLDKSICTVELNEIVSDESGPRRVNLRYFTQLAPTPECKKVFGGTRWF